MNLSLFEDEKREEKKNGPMQNLYSPYCDFIYYPSSHDPNLMLAMRITKPAKPGYILAATHGWHMTIEPFAAMDEPMENDPYLRVQVDMRGRAYSQGQQDCNGYELLDVIDAVNYVRREYAQYILDPEVVYFESGSGGGGNAYALAGKCPDFFAAVNTLYGITDYGVWYDHDQVGEFRDEMDVWVGTTPQADPMAYASRSGLTVLPNLLAPLFMTHGETDERVPVEQARMYAERAKVLGKDGLIEYYEMAGVGNQDHAGNITPEQDEKMRRLAAENLTGHITPINIPRKGTMVGAGYLVTKEFSVFLDSVDKVAQVDYDLDDGTFEVNCPVLCNYKISIPMDRQNKAIIF